MFNQMKKLLKTPAQKRAEEARLAAIAELEEIAEQERKKAERKRKAEERKAKKAEKEAEEKAKKNSSKDAATATGEPWISVLNVDIDPNNPGAGAFELDWNDIFVARLIKAGYQGKTDQDIVDNWFRDVCRNVVMETYEQEQADPEKRANNKKDLGNGRTEIS